jgi:large subunit ribosomal protein L29
VKLREKKELKDLSETELAQRDKDLTEELFNLKFQHATGQLENTQRLPHVRKDLARVKTFLREKSGKNREGRG